MKNKLVKIISIAMCLLTLAVALVVPISAYTMFENEENMNRIDKDCIELEIAPGYYCNFFDFREISASQNYPEGETTIKLYGLYESDSPMELVHDVKPIEDGRDKYVRTYFHKLYFESEIYVFDGYEAYSAYDVTLNIYLDDELYFTIVISFEGDSTSCVNSYYCSECSVKTFQTKFYGIGEDSEYIDVTWMNDRTSVNTSKTFDMEFYTNMSCLKDFGCEVIEGDLGEFSMSVVNKMIFSKSVITPAKTYTEAYDEGYAEGFNDGENEGRATGIEMGYDQGYDVGYAEGDLSGREIGAEIGYSNGYYDGLWDGFNGADTSQAWANMKNLIFAIFDAPFYVISTSLDFNLFGINIAGTLIALISLAIIVWILKIIVVKFF